jgi:phosphohistidine phosphatase SixA
VLVRHAEKAASGGDDPALSDAGEGRARRLADMLRASGVSHLFASEFLRTKATLAPLSVALQRSIVSVPARDQGALLSALESLPRGSLAVVAGHSNTVPALVEKLAQGRAKRTIDDSEYDKLFVVVQWGAERGQQFTLELRF